MGVALIGYQLHLRGLERLGLRDVGMIAQLSVKITNQGGG